METEHAHKHNIIIINIRVVRPRRNLIVCLGSDVETLWPTLHSQDLSAARWNMFSCVLTSKIELLVFGQGTSTGHPVQEVLQHIQRCMLRAQQWFVALHARHHGRTTDLIKCTQAQHHHHQHPCRRPRRHHQHRHHHIISITYTHYYECI